MARKITVVKVAEAKKNEDAKKVAVEQTKAVETVPQEPAKIEATQEQVDNYIKEFSTEEMPDTVRASINTTIEMLHADKQLLKQYKDQTDSMTAEIKDAMRKYDMGSMETENGIIATMSARTSSKLDEEGLLELFLNNGYAEKIPGLVVTRPVIDMEVLENAIYHKDIDATVLAPFKSESVSYTLTTKVKKK